MKVLHTSVFNLAIILNSIDLSSQFDCFPNGDPITYVPGSGSSYTSEKNESPKRSLPLVELPLRSRSRSPSVRYMAPPAMQPPVARSKSSPIIVCSDGRGYKLDQLRFIRLTANENPHQLFEFRLYTFPANEKLKIRAGRNLFAPVPTGEQTVLSTSNGDVFAILEDYSILSGINKYLNRSTRRAKINMGSGIVTLLTKEEIEETPVGSRRPILLNYKVEHVNANSFFGSR